MLRQRLGAHWLWLRRRGPGGLAADAEHAGQITEPAHGLDANLYARISSATLDVSRTLPISLHALMLTKHATNASRPASNHQRNVMAATPRPSRRTPCPT